MLETIIFIAILIYSVILHEVSHGYIAYIFGDKTAKHEGRLSLSPVSHIDPIGSILLPAICIISGTSVFGWAKPVPVNPYNISCKWGMLFVSAAGIAMNFFLAFVAFLVLKFAGMDFVWTKIVLQVMFINISLGLFNLLPIPPFDGVNIVRELGLVKRTRYQFENSPIFMIVMILLAINVFGYIYRPIVNSIMSFL